MLPPTRSEVLAENPNFQKLYTKLATSKLSADGSSQTTTETERHKLLGELSSFNAELAKKKIIISSLQRISLSADGLPFEILQVVDIVAAQLEDRIGSDELDLLEADTETFRANIKTITDALSKDLSYVTEQLFRFASAPDDIVSMSSIRDRQAALLSRRRDLTSKRAAITRLASKILATHSNCIGAGVQILEQTLHGSVERGTRAQAEHLGVVAEGISKKSRIAAQQAKLNLYTPSFQSALQAYAADLDSTIARLKRSEGAAEDELAAYEEAGDGMRDIGSRFAEIKAEVERVQNEIKRVEAR